MSLLDQMKVQAQQVLEEKTSSSQLAAETLAERNAKLKEIFLYWQELADLIKVIQPDFGFPITLPLVGEMTGLKVVEPFADYRYEELANQNFTDEIKYVRMHFFYKAPQVFNIQRELGLAARVEDELWRYGVVHTKEDIKNEQQRVVEAAFSVPWEVKGSVTVTPIPHSKQLHFSLKNIGKLGEVDLEMAFDSLGSEFLDELAKLIMGQENRFWKLVSF
ncbi:MAG TPA: hypothetical protein VK974_03435 [Methylophilaceae bacterium]|nr:hypothetical protein [Methylophilaceae bacterium]